MPQTPDWLRSISVPVRAVNRLFTVGLVAPVGFPFFHEIAANVRLFKVVRPINVPRDVEFLSDPATMQVSIPLVPVDEKRDIEVPIVFRVPTDGTLGALIPKASKIRETFTFIGPPDLLKRMKELEGTGEEIQAVIDLTGLSNDRMAELKKDGIPAKPTFVYPIKDALGKVSCEQPKDIWVSLAKQN